MILSCTAAFLPPTSFLLSSPGSTAEAARIIYPPEAQTIIVTKGQSLILECVASGIPPPRVTWAKDGSSVSAFNKTRFLLSNLLIDPTSEEDSGTYSCTADNGVGEAGAAFIFYNVQVFGECCHSPRLRRGLGFPHCLQVPVLRRQDEFWLEGGGSSFLAPTVSWR